jgi:hypothetical protein
MSFPILRCTALPLVLLLTLAVPAAHAATPRARGGIAAAPWTELARWWKGLAAWWAELDGGCKIDPNGHCLTTAPVQLDGGCGLDPDGCANQ